MDHTEIDTADLDSPRRELSRGGLRIVVCSPYLLFFGINYLCLGTGDLIQL